MDIVGHECARCGSFGRLPLVVTSTAEAQVCRDDYANEDDYAAESNVNCRKFVIDPGVTQFLDNATIWEHRDLYMDFSDEFLWWESFRTITVSYGMIHWAFWNWRRIDACELADVSPGGDAVLNKFAPASVQLTVFGDVSGRIAACAATTGFRATRLRRPSSPTIVGTKFHDVNRNGVNDGEPGLGGWTFKIYRPTSFVDQSDGGVLAATGNLTVLANTPTTSTRRVRGSITSKRWRNRDGCATLTTATPRGISEKCIRRRRRAFGNAPDNPTSRRWPSR